MFGIFIQIAVQNYTIPCISPNFFLSFLILATLTSHLLLLTTHLSLCEALYNINKVYSMLGLDKNQEAAFFLLFFEKIWEKYLVVQKIVVPLHPLSGKPVGKEGDL